MKVEIMLWMLALVAVALAVLSPRYRAQSLMAGGITILAIVAILVFTTRGEVATSTLPGPTAQRPLPQPEHVDFERFHIENLDKNDPEAKNRIAVTEVRFDQIRPEAGPQSGTIGIIAARIYNDSPHFALTDYAYYLVVQDCVKSTCTIIYDQRGWAPVSVPANQARDITVAIRNGDTRGVPTFKVVGTVTIKLSPTGTRSYQSSPATGL